MDLAQFAEQLKRTYNQCHVGDWRIRGRSPDLVNIPEGVNSSIRDQLRLAGIDKLFSHQLQTWEAFRKGSNVGVVTSTNSGKTLCFNLSVLQSLTEEPAARALYLYPTKALAQDQLSKVTALAQPLGVRAAVYDGDTPARRRSAIRKNAHVVLTNPDMLHVGILPRYEMWLPFLRSLRAIVIDEAHVYRGLFGSHTALVLRRLLRLCDWLGAKPQIIAATATISNPSEHLSSLAGRHFELIERDGSPELEKPIVFLSPEVEGDLSPIALSAAILADAASEGFRCMAFSRSRRGAETLLRVAREKWEQFGLPLDSVDAYRGGYLPSERRELERRLFQGELKALVTTNAMELGVDVGALDLVLLNGYPGSVSSFFQQVGRAGRGSRPGLALMIAREDPLEQFIARVPEEVLAKPFEAPGVSLDNPTILSQQLKCMAFERPILAKGLGSISLRAREVADGLVDAGELAQNGDRYYFPSHEPPAPNVDIRSLNGPTLTIRSGAEGIGTAEYWRALQELHTGAVYVHRGETYIVRALDLDARFVDVEPTQVDHYTRAVVQQFVQPTVVMQHSTSEALSTELVGLRVSTMVLGFVRVPLMGGDPSEVEPLDVPIRQYDTVGVRQIWSADFHPELLEAFVPTIHALEHAQLIVAPLIAGCDRSDLGSSWNIEYEEGDGAELFVFDGVPGGVGLSERLYEYASEWLDQSKNLLESCPCIEGCPMCLYMASCSLANRDLDKSAACKVLATAESRLAGR